MPCCEINRIPTNTDKGEHALMKQLLACALATSAIIASIVAPRNVLAQAPTAARGVEPVVIKGNKIPGWSGPAATVVCKPTAQQTQRTAHNSIVTVPVSPPTAVPPN